MASKSLTSRLNRLFNTQVVVRRIGKKRLKVIDTSHLQSSGALSNSRYIERFTRMHSTKQSWSNFNTKYNYHTNRTELYSEYDTMDKDSIIASALDIYSDECTLANESGDILSIISENENVKKILYNLFYDILNIDFNLWAWVRNLCKYGDMYLYLDIEDEVGIVNVIPLSAYEVTREEGFDENNPYEVKFCHEGEFGREIYDNHEVAHFRLLNDANYLPYGKAMIESARKTWKMLSLMEDAMLIHRIMRAPERRVFKIDVGNIPPAEIDQHIQNIMTQMKKTPFIDQATGDYNLKYNMQNLLEDFYLPVRGQGAGNEIDTLSGLTYEAIDDIEYLRLRMMAALKVPKAFLGYEEAVEGKATLAAMDVRFARTIERIQKVVTSELHKMAIVHLASQGYEDAELINFDLQLTNPSIVYQQEMVALWSEKVSLARDLKDLRMISEEWIYQNIFNMSIQEYEDEQVKVIDNLKIHFRKDQIEQEGNDPAKTGESFGTPHDLATLHAPRPGDKNYIEPIDQKNLPTPAIGRPKEGGTYGKHKSNFGYDPLAKKDMQSTFNTDKNPLKHKYKNGSPLHAESAKSGGISPDTQRYLNKLRSKVKIKTTKLLSESLKQDFKTETDSGTILDESKILNIE